MHKYILNQSLGNQIHNLNLKMKKKLDIKIREHGLTSSHQYGVLLLLSKFENMTQKKIADLTFGDEPTTTRMIAKLITKNLVIKQKNPNDKREQFVTLTINGEQLLESLMPYAININNEVKNTISKKEFDTLLNILNKINTNFI